jgi:L-fucose isomerase
MEAGVPVVIWADANTGTCGLVGAAIARGAMDEVGAHANLVCGLFDDPKTCGRVSKLLGAACAAKGLNGQVLGVGGGRSMGMMTGVTDPTDVRTRFGVEIDQFEQMEVIDLAEKIAADRVDSFHQWMAARFGGIVAKEEAVKKQIRLYLALTDFSKEKGYDFVAVKCLPELPGLYTSFCLAHAIMGDAQDHLGAKNRTMFSCEADINAALTMQLMLHLTGGPVLFADLTEFNLETGLLTTCNCGSHPTDFAASPKDVIWEREGVHEFKWKYGGCCPQAVARSGKATVARLSRSKGKYQMLITPVEVVEQPREILRKTVWERPHAFLRILADRDKFIGAVRSNHLHLVYGDYIEELEETCAILGVEPVVVR